MSRIGSPGSTKIAVPTWIALAPARKNSSASPSPMMPPMPITGIRTAAAT